jgi:hypothetical protein
LDILVILGMHRSGTSLCARICRELGVYLGSDLLPGGSDNPDGYFEDRTVVRIHRSIISLLNPGPGADRSITPLPLNWWLRPELIWLFEGLRRWLGQMRNMAGTSLFGFKDPRTARLLPAWTHLFEQMRLRAGYLLCLRNPASVSRSLFQRNAIPPERAEVMWLQHTASCLLNVNGPFMIVEYESWFNDCQAQMDRLQLFLNEGRTAGRLHPERPISDIIDPAKDHSSRPAPASRIPMTNSLYTALRNARFDRAVSDVLRNLALDFCAAEQRIVNQSGQLGPCNRTNPKTLDFTTS